MIFMAAIIVLDELKKKLIIKTDMNSLNDVMDMISKEK